MILFPLLLAFALFACLPTPTPTDEVQTEEVTQDAPPAETEPATEQTSDIVPTEETSEAENEPKSIADAVKLFIAYSGTDLATALSTATAPVNGIATLTWDANSGPMGLYICTTTADLTQLSLISQSANSTPVPIKEVVPVGEYTCAVTANPFYINSSGNVNVIGTPSAADIAAQPTQQFSIVINYIGPSSSGGSGQGGGGSGGSEEGGSGSSGGGDSGGGGSGGCGIDGCSGDQ